MSSDRFFGTGERLYIDYSRMENYGRNCAAENLCGIAETSLRRFLRMMKEKMSVVGILLSVERNMRKCMPASRIA